MGILFNGITDVHRLTRFNPLKEIVLTEGYARHGHLRGIVYHLQFDVFESLTNKLATARIPHIPRKKDRILIFWAKRIKQREAIDEVRRNLRECDLCIRRLPGPRKARRACACRCA